MKQEAGHNLKLKYEWPLANTDDFDMKECETAAFKEWTLLQIEGEEPVPVEETPPEVKPSPTKKGTAAKKDTKAVEEITDNRPRIVQMKRDVAEEMGGGMRFTEPVAIKFSQTSLTLHII